MRSHQPNERANNRRAGAVRLKFVLVGLVALLSVALPQMFSAHSRAATNPPQEVGFTVNTTDDHDDGVCDDADCTLREAIRAANVTSLRETIEFSVKGTINLTSVLPDISNPVRINVPGAELLTVRRNDSDTVRFASST